jgi:hypothetical protein
MMDAPRYYRGGNSLVPRSIDVSIDPATGLLRTGRGVSIQDSPNGLDQFGGAYEVTNVPESLVIIRVGRRPGHHEIAPARPMAMEEYEEALAEIVLVPSKP